MKKILIIGLVMGCFTSVCALADNPATVNIKNNIMYAVANRTPAGEVNVANICTMDVKVCNFGKVFRAGVEVPRDRLRVPINVSGVAINPGETKAVAVSGNTVNLTAYYDTVVLQFTAPVQADLEFPRDFKLVP